MINEAIIQYTPTLMASRHIHRRTGWLNLRSDPDSLAVALAEFMQIDYQPGGLPEVLLFRVPQTEQKSIVSLNQRLNL